MGKVGTIRSGTSEVNKATKKLLDKYNGNETILGPGESGKALDSAFQGDFTVSDRQIAAWLKARSDLEQAIISGANPAEIQRLVQLRDNLQGPALQRQAQINAVAAGLPGPQVTPSTNLIFGPTVKEEGKTYSGQELQAIPLGQAGPLNMVQEFPDVITGPTFNPAYDFTQILSPGSPFNGVPAVGPGGNPGVPPPKTSFNPSTGILEPGTTSPESILAPAAVAGTPDLTQLGSQEQSDLLAARKRYEEDLQNALLDIASKRRELLTPAYQQSVKKGFEALGAQGLGSSGILGSGAGQELVARKAADLERESTLKGLEGILGGKLQGAQLGLEAGMIPSEYRRAGLERQFSLRDQAIQNELDKELAQLQANTNIGMASQTAKKSKRVGYGTILGGLAGGAIGSLVPGGTIPGIGLGSSLGGTLGGILG